MKSIVFFCYVMLTVFLTVSCSKWTPGADEAPAEAEEQLQLVPVEVRTTYSVDEHEWSSARAVGVSKTDATRIALSVFDASNESVYTATQRAADEGSGTFSHIRLAPGTYTFVAVAHRTPTIESAAANITSPTVAILQGSELLGAVYACTQQVTITASNFDTQSVDMMLQLCIAAVKIHLKDALPVGVQKITMTVNTGQPGFTSLTFNPATALCTDNVSFTRTWDVSQHIGTSNANFIAYAHLNAYPKTVTVSISALRADDEELFTRTFSNIELKQSVETNIYTHLFTGDAAPELTFEEWSKETVTID